MDKYYKNINLMQLILKWKVHIIVITIIGGIAGAIFSGSFFITPLFKSEAVLYPANIMPYSDESETEQMLQIMQSGDIRDAVIDKFDLPKHYEISPDYKYFLTVLHNEYNDHISISKTQYESVRVTVKDKDPQVACDIANEIVALYDKKLKTLQKSKFKEVVDNYVKVITKKEVFLDSLNVRMELLATNYGLVNYQSQSREITRAVLENNRAAKALQKNMEQKSGEFLMLKNLIERESANLSSIRRDYDLAFIQYNREYTYSNVVSTPFAADKKVYPVRWVIVLLSMIAALFFSLIIIGIIESTRRANARA